MVEYDESIYNLIPKEQYVPQKPKRYRSQYPPNMAPTASTFGLKTTSKPVCSNLSGKFNLEGGAHSHQANGATFGAAKGTLKPDTTMFRKKGTGNPVLIPKTEGKWPFLGKTVPPLRSPEPPNSPFLPLRQTQFEKSKTRILLSA